MIKLLNSGLPMYLNQENYIMALSAELQYDGYSRKYVKDMVGLLADERNLNLNEPFYDVYRGIRFPKDQQLLKDYDYRYDITIVMDGLVNGECKKTSGHYHGYNAERTISFPEVYEVVKGTALYILQWADNFDTNPENVDIKDVIFATVNEGEAIIIPPNYGHCSINIGVGPLVFSNLAYVSCPVRYDSVQFYKGLSYYVMKKNNKINFVKNNHYTHVPEAKKFGVKESKEFGLRFGFPVYQSFLNNPDTFSFLKDPAPYFQEIMNLLVEKK